jgi:hypothetical protein
VRQKGEAYSDRMTIHRRNKKFREAYHGKHKLYDRSVCNNLQVRWISAGYICAAGEIFSST